MLRIEKFKNIPSNWPPTSCLSLTLNINPYAEIEELWIREQLEDMKMV